jgi:hypothetical protein
MELSFVARWLRFANWKKCRSDFDFAVSKYKNDKLN